MRLTWLYKVVDIIGSDVCNFKVLQHKLYSSVLKHIAGYIRDAAIHNRHS